MYTDTDYFRIHPAMGYPKLRKWENGENLEEKYWLHVWKMINFSYASNAIAFAEPKDIGVKKVELFTKDGKTSAKVKPGKFLLMGIAKVTPSDGKIADAFCEYSVSGAQSDKTRIDPQNGTLYVGSDETAGTLTITGVSHLDNTKSGTLTVTIQH